MGGGADFTLYSFSCSFSDKQVMVAAKIVDNIIIQFVTAQPHGLGKDDPRKRDDSYFGGTPAHIHDHIANRLMDIQPDPYRSRHGLVDKVDRFSSRVFGAVAHGAPFYFGNPAGYTDNHLAGTGIPFHFDLVDHSPDHLFSNFKICNNSVPEG